LGKFAVLLSLLAILSGLCLPAAAAAPEKNQSSAPAPETADFDACARLALRQSPYFTKSSLEIDIRRLDEKDSKAELFPNFVLRTRYYVVRPTQVGSNADNYAVELACDQYNPMESYLSVKIRRLLTRLAILAHHKIIAEGLFRLAKGFLELDSLERLAQMHQDAVALAQKGVAYQQQLVKIGEASALEVKIAQQELDLALSEQERLRQTRLRAQEALRNSLALNPDQQLNFDLRQVPRQVLGAFDPAAATLEQVKARSQDLKIEAIKKELQSWRITLAKARLFPNFNLGLSTPDPRSFADTRGLFVSLGLNWQVPFLDGGKSVRDIQRQKTVLKQFEAEGGVKGLDIEDKWQAAREGLRAAAAALKLAQSQEELARLRERQADIAYHSGKENFATWLKGRKAVLEAQALVMQKSLDHYLAQLSLRHQVGDLLYRYVDERIEQQ
jgi:outer membrane protein TolC